MFAKTLIAIVLFGSLRLSAQTAAASPVAIAVDQTNYNVGSRVMGRLTSVAKSTVAIRYAGESTPLVTGLPLKGTDYQPLWTIPSAAKTGRYEIDLTGPDGKQLRGVAGFAVHRQLAKVVAFDLDKTFYTAGDPVNPRIVVQNISDQPLRNLQVEFENYTYPWIAPAADEPPSWKTVASSSLSLEPGATQEFRLQRAAVVQANSSQTNIYFSAVIRDSQEPDHIYDLAFALPAITAPAGGAASKTYPMLYLYPHEQDLPASESYRQFYPPAYVSDVITFSKDHTTFSTEGAPSFSFKILSVPAVANSKTHIEYRVLDKSMQPLKIGRVDGQPEGEHHITLDVLKPGLYTLEVELLSDSNQPVTANRLDFTVNKLPKSILIFCAHEDDDTAHPELIRAAIENNIPLHIVYFTSGDAGGCDRYYMHSCDASRAMDFGEVRMAEARASLGHLGVPSDDIFFLGLPDGGMEQIWSKYLTAEKPYLSVLLASEHSPYAASAVPNLPYAREPVVQAAESFLRKYQPELVITGHPDERHVDHRTNNWVVVKAMQDLLRKGTLSADTELIVDQVYGPGPQKHAPYKYEKTEFYVSGEVARLGQEATWYYQTQDGNHQQAEITPYSKLPRTASPNHFGDYHWPYPHYRILDWQKHEGWNETVPAAQK